MCAHCGARLLYQLPERPMRIASACPHCNEASYSPTRAKDFQDFFALLTAMPRLTEGSTLGIRRRAGLSPHLRYDAQNQRVVRVNAPPGPRAQRSALQREREPFYGAMRG